VHQAPVGYLHTVRAYLTLNRKLVQLTPDVVLPTQTYEFSVTPITQKPQPATTALADGRVWGHVGWGAPGARIPVDGALVTHIFHIHVIATGVVTGSLVDHHRVSRACACQLQHNRKCIVIARIWKGSNTDTPRQLQTLQYVYLRADGAKTNTSSTTGGGRSISTSSADYDRQR
jgi:hypothetical protein